jgi:zinc protease
MMHRQLASALALFALLAVAPAPVAAQQAGLRPDSPLPVDPQVRMGQFENGLRYYVRANARPENRAELRLVVHAGSVLEDDDQRGLAHFVEHMAFNGTRHFQRQELVHYLESIGMRFGPDLNAYTGFDETVYMLTIPTDSAQVVATAFHILEEWATNVTFDPAAIDRERGVVIEEWRGGRDAQARLLDQQVPVLLKDSRYAERLPIGRVETLEGFPHEALIRFYERWYRPDLMAVVAVGDFDPDVIEAHIRERFEHIARPATPANRPLHTVPHHDETLFHTAVDPELPFTRIQIEHKQPGRSRSTVADFRLSLVERAFNGMLNARFEEITQEPDAPFLAAGSSRGTFVGSTDVYSLGAVVVDGGVETGLRALLVEAERVARHGFTQTELDRYKLNLLRAYESAYAERARTSSGVYAAAYVSHFLNGSPVPGIEIEYQLAQSLVPGIRLEEIDRLAREWMTEENRVVLVSAPDKDGAMIPDADGLRQAIAAVAAADIDAYIDSVTDEPLVAQPPAPVAIIEERHHEDVDVHEWRLANGVRVLLKQTDFRDDEILLRAYSPGGSSIAPDHAFVSASFAADVVQSSGVGAFRVPDLERALAGKAVRVAPIIGELEQGFSGSASPRDAETLMQLIYLYFTAPRHEPQAVEAMTQQIRAILANRSMDPGAAFGDTLQVTLTQYHPRTQPPTAAMLDALDAEAAYAFFLDRFSDASDFTFVLVGNLDLDALRPLVQSYLGGLPSTGRSDSWRDTGVRPPTGVIEKVVRQGLEPRAMTRLVFTGPMEYSRQNAYALRALGDVLDIRLREVLREELGGTYGVQVSAAASVRPERRYTINIAFGAAPERLDELTMAVFSEIERIRSEGPRDEELSRVREIHRREREASLRQNAYWLNQLVAYDRDRSGFTGILNYEGLIDGLTGAAVQGAAQAWLRADNYVRVSLLPASHD